MRRDAEFVPGPTDRAAFIGQTGSGKTTLARVILERREWCVVYDPKGLIAWPGWQQVKGLEQLRDSRSPRIVYKPSYAELRDPDDVDRFFRWIYDRRHTTLYVDEVYAICNGPEYPWHYGACLTRGRERGVSVFTATQRPASIPMVCLSESEYYYVFFLKLDQDRERVEKLTGIDRDSIKALRKHRFYFAPQDAEAAGPFYLELSSQRGTRDTSKGSAVRAGHTSAA